MKKDTMKRLATLPKDAQEKVWQLAQDRLKQEKLAAKKMSRPEDTKKK